MNCHFLSSLLPRRGTDFGVWLLVKLESSRGGIPPHCLGWGSSSAVMEAVCNTEVTYYCSGDEKCFAYLWESQASGVRWVFFSHCALYVQVAGMQLMRVTGKVMSVIGSSVISGLQCTNCLTGRRHKVVFSEWSYSGFIWAEILLLKTIKDCKIVVPAPRSGKGRGALSVLPQKSLTQTYGIYWKWAK